jgi:hypothetical protein
MKEGGYIIQRPFMYFFWKRIITHYCCFETVEEAQKALDEQIMEDVLSARQKAERNETFRAARPYYVFYSREWINSIKTR